MYVHCMPASNGQLDHNFLCYFHFLTQFILSDLQGDIGPFNASLPTEAPLWIAIFLKDIEAIFLKDMLLNASWTFMHGTFTGKS